MPLTSIKVACDLLGMSRATVYRRRNPTQSTGRLPRAPAVHPAALDDTERERLLELLNSDRFVDKSAAQVWATLLDEGVYLASVSTMYRLLRARHQTVERRAQATHPARKKPELLATRPNEIWSWDITKLTGPVRGVCTSICTSSSTYSPAKPSTSRFIPPRPVNSQKPSSSTRSP
ncbi:hypothetical protein FMEAI12_2600018 [Parafrankia sp. Ea1.12]|nr:hypothetical protein FMEAI12_2600018 [Parafrankia sp. Ea1.12]